MTALNTLGFAQEVLRDVGTLQCHEEAVPGGGFARQDNVTSLWVLANQDFLGVEPKGRRQAHGLATAVGGLPFRRYITGNVAVMRLGHCTLVELSPQTPKTLTGGPAQA